MLALSVRQPWAELIASGIKRLEHRSWPIAHRGPLLIHAARAVPRLAQHRALPRGVAVAIVDVIDCIEVTPKEFVWVLAHVRRTEPVSLLGRQRLWQVHASDLRLTSNRNLKTVNERKIQKLNRNPVT
jgi:hypothetical protein